MICYDILKDFEQCGAEHLGRWVQRVVLINKKDVNEVYREGNRVSFTLIEGKRGYHFEYGSTFMQVLGNYEVLEKFNYNQYRHNVQVALSGFDYDTKGINNGEYFAVLLNNKGRVYVFGFDYLLKPEEYLYESHEMNSITLRSTDIGLEDSVPLLYVSDTDVKDDFYDDFEDTDLVEQFGEFSDDFNNDFNI